MIPYKNNPLANIVNNVSSFKVQGIYVKIQIQTVTECIVDFGDGTKQTYPGNMSLFDVTHDYAVDGEYIVNVIGNHSWIRAWNNIIECFQLSESVRSCHEGFQHSNLQKLASTFKFPKRFRDGYFMFYGKSALDNEFNALPDTLINGQNMFTYCTNIKLSLNKLPPNLQVANRYVSELQKF